MVAMKLSDPALTGTASAAFTSIGPPSPLTRAQRVRRFGVDCGEGLEWAAGWEPGGEYVKQLVVKNVTTKAMKLRYKLPKSKYFSMAFPETVQLMPGLSHSMPVSFRPIKLEEYDDCVQFWNEKGSFVVPVRAWIPKVSTCVPESLDFGFCPVKETAVKTFAISNPGEVPVSFSWTCDGPFTLTPSVGTLAPGAAASITARFMPKDASVSVAQCVCDIPEHQPHVMRVGGIGKYPFLSSSVEIVDCGSVLTGAVARTEFKLSNKSLVYARFTIARRERDVAPAFSLTPTSGVVPPDGDLMLSLVYHPTATGTYTREHYDVSTPGGNVLTIEAVGEAVGPVVELSKASVNFGDVPIELPRRTVGRVLEIFNRSAVPVPFQLHGVEPNGIFAVSPTSGVLPAGLSGFVNLHFSPDEPGNYYKRVHVLFANRAPLVIDVLGTGYTDKRRPMTLALKDVRGYLARERRGLHLLSPEDLEARAAARREAVASGQEPEEEEEVARDDGAAAAEREVMQAVFRGSSSAESALHFDEEYLDFGACSRLRVGEPRTVRLFNRTSGKLVVYWVVPGGYADGGARDKEGPAFSVSPATAELLPHSSATFRVQFRPRSDQQYFCQRLECVASFKSMRSFRLVTPDSMTPPWTLALTAHGHTFPAVGEQFASKPRLSHRTLTFPACHAGDTTYQTISLANEGDTPMHFAIAPDPAGIFAVVPPIGVVPPGAIQMLALRFSPREVAPYQCSLCIVLNHSPASQLRLQLLGAGARASLHMAHGGRLFMPTTCVGASSRASIRLTNPSRLPIAYEWDLTGRGDELLAVSPAAGVLQGHESVDAVWTFAPTSPTQHLLKVPCLVSALDDAGGGASHDIVRQLLTVSGAGSSGNIRAEPEMLHFGPVLVGQSHRRQLALVNSSAVDLFYEVTFERTANSAMEEPGEGERVGCSKPSGLVPARNSVLISVELEAWTRGDVEYAVLCTLAAGAGGYGGARASLGPPVQLGLVRARAEYPLLQLVDARLAGVSQETLWGQLGLAEANAELRSLLGEAEKLLASEQGAPPEMQLAPANSLFRSVDVNLPPGHLGGRDQAVLLLMRNTGSLPAKWSIKYPNEADLQLPHWVDAAELSPEELKQGMLVDRGIFTAHPRKGELAPGADALITIGMSHVAADEFELPLLLVVESGKRLILNVRGRTLAPREPYLHLPSRELLLGPTPLGLPKPHRHTLELPNWSDVPLAYELDTGLLATLNEHNFGFDVLSCAEPRGVIPPGGTARIPFAFQPLEAREYTLAVPLRVGDADGREEPTTRVLRLKALGHDPADGSIPAAHEAARLALAPPFQQIAMAEAEQPMRLSLDRCVFGRAPIGSSVRQLVVLSNKSSCPCEFEWDTTHPMYGLRVTVYPSHGTVAAGQHLCCKVTMVGAGPAENLRFTLACNLEPQWTPELAAANAALVAEAAAKAEAARSGRQSVTVATPKLRGITALHAMGERQQRIARLAAAGRAGTPEPPPAAPRRTLLLDLSANFLPADALEQAGVDLKSFYVPRVLPPTEEEKAEFRTARSPPAPAGSGGVSHDPTIRAEQRDAVQYVVQQMLQELMRCDDVKHAFELAPMRPVPWFAQIAHGERGTAPQPVTIVAAGGDVGAPAELAAARATVHLHPELEASLASAGHEAAAAAAARREEDRAARAETERLNEIKASAELQELAAYVLEGTLFNLVAEASHGEFSLDVAPRQIIKPFDTVVRRKL